MLWMAFYRHAREASRAHYCRTGRRNWDKAGGGQPRMTPNTRKGFPERSFRVFRLVLGSSTVACHSHCCCPGAVAFCSFGTKNLPASVIPSGSGRRQCGYEPLSQTRHGFESRLAGSTQNSSLGFNSTLGSGGNFDSSKGGSCGAGAPSSWRCWRALVRP